MLNKLVLREGILIGDYSKFFERQVCISGGFRHSLIGRLLMDLVHTFLDN